MSPITLKKSQNLTFESGDDRPMIDRRSADTSADEKDLIQI